MFVCKQQKQKVKINHIISKTHFLLGLLTFSCAQHIFHYPVLRCGPTHPHTAQILSGRVVIPPQIVEPIDDTRRHCQCKVTHKHSREIAREDEPLRGAVAFLIDLQRRRRVIWLVRPAHGLAEPTTTTAGHGNYCRETYDTFI